MKEKVEYHVVNTELGFDTGKVYTDVREAVKDTCGKCRLHQVAIHINGEFKRYLTYKEECEALKPAKN